MTDHDDLARYTSRLRLGTRRSAHALWVPLVTAGGLTVLSGILSLAAGPRTFALYWPVGIALAAILAAGVAWTRLDATRPIQGRVLPRIAGLSGVLVLIGLLLAPSVHLLLGEFGHQILWAVPVLDVVHLPAPAHALAVVVAAGTLGWFERSARLAAWSLGLGVLLLLTATLVSSIAFNMELANLFASGRLTGFVTSPTFFPAVGGSLLGGFLPMTVTGGVLIAVGMLLRRVEGE